MSESSERVPVASAIPPSFAGLLQRGAAGRASVPSLKEFRMRFEHGFRSQSACEGLPGPSAAARQVRLLHSYLLNMPKGASEVRAPAMPLHHRQADDDGRLVQKTVDSHRLGDRPSGIPDKDELVRIRKIPGENRHAALCKLVQDSQAPQDVVGRYGCSQ